jgi:drug/metabolite transporter (DMT)-like permease
VHLVPVFGTILAVLLLGEAPHPYHAVGIGLIFTGIWFATRKPTG